MDGPRNTARGRQDAQPSGLNPDGMVTPLCATGAVVTITAPVSMNVDSLQSLSSDGATLAVQQVMMAEQSEDDSVDSTGDGGAALAPGHLGGLVLENSDSLQ